MATRLLPFSVALLDAEAVSVGALCQQMGVAAPVDWPPPFGDSGVRNWFRKQLAADPSLAPWLGHYVVHTRNGDETLVGTAGYKGPPDHDGMVEIGYSIVPAYHRTGIGSAAVGLLLVQAFGDRRVSRVTAETPLTATASRALLAKMGFATVGTRTDPEDGELALYRIERA